MTKDNENLSNYEVLLIIGTDKSQEEAEKIVNATVDFLKKKKTKEMKLDLWGKRQLAYPVKHQKEGFYFILRFLIDKKVLPLLHKHLQINENLLRFLVLRKGV